MNTLNDNRIVMLGRVTEATHGPIVGPKFEAGFATRGYYPRSCGPLRSTWLSNAARAARRERSPIA